MLGDRVHDALGVLDVALGLGRFQARGGIVVAGLPILERTCQDGRELPRERAGVDEAPVECSQPGSGSEEHSLPGHVQPDGQSLAGRPLPFVAQETGHQRSVLVQEVHLDLEESLTDVPAASVDDDNDVVVGIVPGIASGAGAEEDYLADAGAEAVAHPSCELDGHGVGDVARLHSGMLARGPVRVLGIVDPSAPGGDGGASG